MSINHPWFNVFALNELDYVNAVQIATVTWTDLIPGDKEWSNYFEFSGTQTPGWLEDCLHTGQIKPDSCLSDGDDDWVTWDIQTGPEGGDTCRAMPDDWIVLFPDKTLLVIPDLAFRKLFQEGFKVASS